MNEKYQTASATRAQTDERIIENLIGIDRHFNLLPADIRTFEASGIPLEYQKSYGLRRVSDEIGAEVVLQKRVAGRSFAGIILPIYSAPGGSVAEFELRRDTPDRIKSGDQEKESGKYLRPPGKSFLAFPPDATVEESKDISIPVIACEGSKKMMSADYLSEYKLADCEKRRFLPVAISGVYGLRGKVGKTTSSNGQAQAVKGLLTGFQSLELKHRPVIIIFDNDTHTNFKVAHARNQAGQTLQNETGAVVYFVDLPKSNRKIGLDDLIGEWYAEGGADLALKNFEKLLSTKYLYSGEIKSSIADGKLIIGVQPADRKKCKVTVKDANGEVLAVDSFNLAEADKRNKFIKQVESAFTLSEAEKTELTRELLRLAETSELLTEAEAPAPKQTETIETDFQILKDGRIIEQTFNGLAVYDPNTDEFETVESVTDEDGTNYAPIDDELFKKRGSIYLADELADYGTENELIKDIESYLSTYLDIEPLFLRLTALYIMFSYITDSESILELSYLNPTGDPGSGKSRFGLAVCIASRRGFPLITPSAASVYRILDKFKPTLFIDEFNSDANTDDAAAIIQILNAGFQRVGQIPRQVGTTDGDFKTQMFDPFGAKIFGSLKQSASNAFNSRCIEIQMKRTTRNDIPLRLSRRLLNHAAAIRNKLTLWRMRNIQTDFDSRLDQAEKELRECEITPRSIQINIPLFALMSDDGLKRDFIKLLKGRDAVLAEEKSLSINGEIVDKLHTLLFDTDEDGTTLNSRNFSELPKEGEPCEQLTVERLLGMMNANRPKEIAVQSFGKMLLGLNLTTKKILKRESANRQKKAIVFNLEVLLYQFRIHNLPVPEEFNGTNGTKNDKPNENLGLDVVPNNESDSVSGTVWNQPKPNEDNIYKTGSIGSIENTGKGQKTNETTLQRSKENSTEPTGISFQTTLKPNVGNNNGERSNWSKEETSESLDREVFEI